MKMAFIATAAIMSVTVIQAAAQTSSPKTEVKKSAATTSGRSPIPSQKHNENQQQTTPAPATSIAKQTERRQLRTPFETTVSPQMVGMNNLQENTPLSQEDMEKFSDNAGLLCWRLGYDLFIAFSPSRIYPNQQIRIICYD